MEQVDRVTTTCLPAQPTPLIGRATEIAAVRQLVQRDDVRLVTITGTAGIGKTRLAVAAASELHACFPDGTLFVDLSSISDPTRVLVAIAQSLGLLEVTPLSAAERLRDVMADHARLLVLDNFEQVLPAATDLAGLLGETNHLKLLVTSRTPLHVRWEHVFETPPLELPDLNELRSADLTALGHIPAVALFMERADAAGSTMQLSTANAHAVAELCVRLDGLPLALELAATQTRHISLETLVARMDHRLDLLAVGAVDQPERQRTLRDAIGWSYALLSVAQQAVFRRLGVFVGGISLEAARAVVASDGDPADMLPSLVALADKHLLQRDLSSRPDGEPSFRMLATIREYAREQLHKAGELLRFEYQYATHWRDVAEQAQAQLRGPTQVDWLNRLDRERINLEAALTWSDRNDEIELGVRLAAALSWFWYLRGGDRSGARAWLERFASRSASLVSTAVARANALSAAGLIAQYQLDLPAALVLQDAALRLGQELHSSQVTAMALGRLAHLSLFRTELPKGDNLASTSYEQYRELNDRWGMAFALGTRGLIARSQGRTEDATGYLQQSLKLFREEGDRWGIAHVMLGLGQLALHRGNAAEAAQCWEERLRLSREIDNQTGVAHTLDLLATLARQSDDYERARRGFEEALVIKRKIGDRQATAWALQGVGELALMRGELRVAYAHLRESLLLRRDIAEQPGLVPSLAAFARLAARLGRPARAVRLAAAAAALRKAVGPTLAVQHYSVGVLPAEAAPLLPEVERVQRRLGPAQRARAWDEGSAMPLDQAISEALGLETELPGPGQRRDPLQSELTRRERQLAALLARGCSNREVAAALVITEGSAHVQVVRLLNKLGLHSRAQVAAWAVTQNL
ncbi:MAG: tetratricopeptide repeat protein [Chloroflexota bacterium]|nr:tetratricopeptide repeat protein [Chloroflexota bacterium]